MLKQNLAQKQLQKLSPQQIQLMKLLQVPTALLDQRIKEELEANPALEEGDKAIKDEKIEVNSDTDDEHDDYEGTDTEIDLGDYLADDFDQPDYKLRDNNYPDPDNNFSLPIPVIDTFQDFLEQQLSMVSLEEDDRIIARQIIGSIDEDGYLRRPVSSTSFRTFWCRWKKFKRITFNSIKI